MLLCNNFETSLEGELGRHYALWQFVVAALVCYIGAETSVEHLKFGLGIESLYYALGLGLAFGKDKLHCLFEGDCQRVCALGNRDVNIVVLDVGTKAAGADGDALALELTGHARQAEELQRLFEADCLHCLSGLHLREAGLLFVGRCSYLHNGAETTNLDRYGLAAHGICTQNALAHLVLALCLQNIAYLRVELFVEGADGLYPLLFALGNGVEILLHGCGEVVVHNLGEVGEQKIVHHKADVSGHEFGLFGTHLLFFFDGGNVAVNDGHAHKLTLDAGLVAAFHVTALLNGADGGGIC